MNPLGLATWLRHRAERDGEKPAVTFGGDTISFAALQGQIEGFADLLAACDVGPGDRMA